MIRWYDYTIALVAADFIWYGIKLVLFGSEMWHGFMGGIIVLALLRFWTDYYIPLRHEKEFN